jgi:UDP-N-acetylmuramate dehydrogenase
MKILENVPLREFNSFGVPSVASRLVRLDTVEDAGRLGAGAYNPERDLVLGGGSNVLLTRDVDGTVWLNRIPGKRIIDDDGQTALVEVGAGENWHDFVAWTLDQGLCGLENLSLIPGLAGAAPMQNIGAYGVEVSDVLDSVTALDWQSGEAVDLASSECAFAYRDSRFKSADAGRFLLLRCRLRLRREALPDISYAGLAEELAAMGVTRPNARQVSEAVVRLRRRKLPDPAEIGNAGSFFKNPEVSAATAQDLLSRHASMPVHLLDGERAKLSAAWMIERCGWKGHREGGAGVSEKHALVLVNHGGATGKELFELSERIAKSVFERFGIRLEREPVVY